MSESIADKSIPAEKVQLSNGEEYGSVSDIVIDSAAEKAYVRKLDIYLLPFLSLMYFFSAVDRNNLGNAYTDGIAKDLHFTGNEYSLLVLLFYVPNGLGGLPMNLLIKRFSTKIIIPILVTTWGVMALLQCATKNFGGLLVLRLFIGICESGFYAGVVYYLTLFYTRGELGFRIAIFFGSAVLAGAFSGLISFGVFQIDNKSVYGWQWLFIIEGSLTVVVGVVAFFWLPKDPQHVWFLSDAEKAAATARTLRDGSLSIDSKFDWKACRATWGNKKFILWCIICFAYPTTYATVSNFLPQIVARLGYSVTKTNLYTVAPNAVGFVSLLCITWSSDHFRERTFHIMFALGIALIGLILLVAIDVLENKGVSYFACFLIASGAYTPTVLVHAWHNNNSLDENSRAATTGLLVGLGNLGPIITAATFRVEYAPKYIPTMISTIACNALCIILIFCLGGWMKLENKKRNKEQGVNLRAGDVATDGLVDGEKSPQWRYFS